MEDSLADRFSRDAEFAPDMIELADERLSALPPAPESERAQWAGTRLKAMAALGDEPGALHAYARSSGLLGSADAVRLIADAYAAAGKPHEALSLLHESMDAREPYRSARRKTRPPRIVDRLVGIANESCTEEELAKLYASLLLREGGREIRDDDLKRWYDELQSAGFAV